MPRADAERNNERILTAAARILAEDPGATLQRIADEAGVVRLTIYRRYRNKEALRQAIFEAAAVQAKAAIADALARDLGPREALRALIVAMAGTIQRYPVLAVNTEWQPMPGDRHRPTPPPAARSMHKAVYSLVLRGQREGVLRSDLPAHLLPQAITGTLHVVTRFATTLRTDPDDIGEQVADLLLNGFSADP